MKKYIAEALGTGTLTLVVGLSLAGTFPISTPILAGIVVGLFVYTIGHLSGCHINPAVTIGAWSIKKIESRDALFYIIAQFIGVLAAMLVMRQATGVLTLSDFGSFEIMLFEALGTFFLTFGIASVVYDKVSSQASGIVIGGSLILGITVAALLGTNGVLNPAVALGVGSFSWAYILGPIIGSILGMNVYKHLAR